MKKWHCNQGTGPSELRSDDGHSHQAHVDHLLPGTSNLDVDSPTPYNEQAD